MRQIKTWEVVEKNAFPWPDHFAYDVQVMSVGEAIMRTALILSLAATIGCESDSAVKVFNAAPEAAITSHEDGAAVKEATEILFLGAGSDPDHSVDELEGSWQSGASPLCEWTPLQADGVSECAVTASVLLTEITFLVRDPTDSVASASILRYV